MIPTNDQGFFSLLWSTQFGVEELLVVMDKDILRLLWNKIKSVQDSNGEKWTRSSKERQGIERVLKYSLLILIHQCNDFELLIIMALFWNSNWRSSKKSWGCLRNCICSFGSFKHLIDYLGIYVLSKYIVTNLIVIPVSSILSLP